MSKGKKDKPLKLTFKREQRLAKGKKFLEVYDGKRLVYGYAKRFKVDKLCAIKELRMLGVDVPKSYEEGLKKQMEAERRKREEKKRMEQEKQEREEAELGFCIVGETSNGVPFGVIYDENIDYLTEDLYLIEHEYDNLEF